MLWELKDLEETGPDVGESSSGESCSDISASESIETLEANSDNECCGSASSVSSDILSSSNGIPIMETLGAGVGDSSSILCEALVPSARFSRLFRKEGCAGYLRNTDNVGHFVLFLAGERTRSSSFARS